MDCDGQTGGVGFFEAEGEEVQAKLYHLRYPIDGAAPAGLPKLPDGRAYIVVATTRPETMLGDVAVAVHPEDERYRDLVGRTLRLPITGIEIPVVADTYTDPAFGTANARPADPADVIERSLAVQAGGGGAGGASWFRPGIVGAARL